jgi:uncharacterized Zn finger protein (UPF0148 family)
MGTYEKCLECKHVDDNRVSRHKDNPYMYSGCYRLSCFGPELPDFESIDVKGTIKKGAAEKPITIQGKCSECKHKNGYYTDMLKNMDGLISGCDDEDCFPHNGFPNFEPAERFRSTDSDDTGPRHATIQVACDACGIPVDIEIPANKWSIVVDQPFTCDECKKKNKSDESMIEWNWVACCSGCTHWTDTGRISHQDRLGERLMNCKKDIYIKSESGHDYITRPCNKYIDRKNESDENVANGRIETVKTTTSYPVGIVMEDFDPGEPGWVRMSSDSACGTVIDMKKCTGCTRWLPEGALYCPRCGKKVDEEPPEPSIKELERAVKEKKKRLKEEEKVRKKRLEKFKRGEFYKMLKPLLIKSDKIITKVGLKIRSKMEGDRKVEITLHDNAGDLLILKRYYHPYEVYRYDAIHVAPGDWQDDLYRLLLHEEIKQLDEKLEGGH